MRYKKEGQTREKRKLQVPRSPYQNDQGRTVQTADLCRTNGRRAPVKYITYRNAGNIRLGKGGHKQEEREAEQP